MLVRWAPLVSRIGSLENRTVGGRRQHPAEPGRIGAVRGLGCSRVRDRLCGRGGGSGGEGDRLARELLELADQVVFLAVPAAAGLVEVGAQVAVAGFGVGQQVPDDGQDRVADRDQGALLATAFGDAAVALAEEGAGAPGRDGDLGRGWRPATGCPCRWPPSWPCRLRCWLGARTSPTPPGARRSGRRPCPRRARR